MRVLVCVRSVVLMDSVEYDCDNNCHECQDYFCIDVAIADINSMYCNQD